MRTPLLVCTCLLLAGCGERPVKAGDERSQTTKVGFSNESPFAYLDRGKLTGEAPELARYLLTKLGMPEVEGVLTEFGSLVPGLKARRFALIAAGMYITPERCKEVLFSEPTYCVREALLVAKGNPRKLHSYDDVVRDRAARLAVVRGAAQQGYAEALGLPAERVAVYPDPASALSGLASGRVEAFAATALTIEDLLNKLGQAAEVERASPFSQPVIQGKPVLGCGGFAFRKEDVALRDAFNRELRDFLGTERHLSRVRPFGLSADELPPADITTAALCSP